MAQRRIHYRWMAAAVLTLLLVLGYVAIGRWVSKSQGTVRGQLRAAANPLRRPPATGRIAPNARISLEQNFISNRWDAAIPELARAMETPDSSFENVYAKYHPRLPNFLTKQLPPPTSPAEIRFLAAWNL